MHIKIHNYKLKDLGSIHNLSLFLAQYFPHPEQCATGIYELLLNAVEHGNLGIGFDAKTTLIREGKWHEEITRRLSENPSIEKDIEITLTHNEHECRLSIADQGEGFAWKNYVGLPSDERRPNGRGLWIVFNSNFDEVTFNQAGNEVTCIARY